uniref:F-box domain-containing protein n=1 Tax=Oryza meridionalis TaxID=40149 RepID=A0A0E0FC23_9ORYZ
METTNARPEKRHRIAAAAAAAVPDDVLFSNILVHLPVKSLARLKCVSRSWLAAVEDPAFVRRHLELSRARPSAVIVVVPPKDGSISFHRFRQLQVVDATAMDDSSSSSSEVELMLERAFPDGVEIDVATHCDGLIAVTTDAGETFVCNPATKELVTLPLGISCHNDCVVRDRFAAIGYDPWRNRYVVCRYFHRRYPNRAAVAEIGHEIFVLGGGGGGSWEVTEDPPPTSAIVPSTPPACIGGCFYWCTNEDVDNLSMLLRFSLHNHKFDMVPCHPGCSSDVFAFNTVSELDGKLCYTHIATERKTTSRLWMLDGGDMARPEWSMRCCIDVGDYVSCVSPLVAGGEHILLSVDEKLYLYGERSRVLEKVVDTAEVEYARSDGSKYKLGYDLYSQHYYVPYVESLAQKQPPLLHPPPALFVRAHPRLSSSLERRAAARTTAAELLLSSSTP